MASPRSTSRRALRRALALASLLTATAASAPAQLVRSAAGSTTGDITATVNQFRADLGDPNNANAPGPLAGGRREINWDGGGATTTTPSGTPLTAFTTIRGATFSTPGSGFEQNAQDFANINASYATTFEAFSPLRLFSAIGSNIVDVTFSIPGVGGPAATRGFGAVFSDVDIANLSSLAFFDVLGNSLGTFFVPNVVGANQTFSFLGVSYADAIIGRVRITAGNAALGPNDGGGTDVVVMDDFLYAEPQAVAVIPEPATLLLTATGLALGALAVRRRTG